MEQLPFPGLSGSSTQDDFLSLSFSPQGACHPLPPSHLIEEAPPGKEDESFISESILKRVKMMDELPDPLAPPRSINKIGFQAPNFHIGETGCTHGMGDPSFGT